jgi:hypothetical protein
MLKKQPKLSNVRGHLFQMAKFPKYLLILMTLRKNKAEGLQQEKRNSTTIDLLRLDSDATSSAMIP